MLSWCLFVLVTGQLCLGWKYRLYKVSGCSHSDVTVWFVDSLLPQVWHSGRRHIDCMQSGGLFLDKRVEL